MPITKHGSNAWIAAGSALVTVGGIGAGVLATVASTSEREAQLWHHDWFLALMALCGFAVVFGLYSIFAQVFPSLPFWRELPVQSQSPAPAVDLAFEQVVITAPMNLQSSDGTVVGQGIYCHAVIKASAKLDPVKGEAIRLEHKDDAGRYVAVEDFKAPQELRWDKPYVNPEEYRSETIYPDVPGRLNIVNTESHDPECVTHLSVRRHGPGMGVTKLLPGDYRLTVRVSAPGARSADAAFLIHSGSWDELAVEMESRDAAGS